jgi:hypothetical protein
VVIIIAIIIPVVALVATIACYVIKQQHQQQQFQVASRNSSPDSIHISGQSDIIIPTVAEEDVEQIVLARPSAPPVRYLGTTRVNPGDIEEDGERLYQAKSENEYFPSVVATNVQFISSEESQLGYQYGGLPVASSDDVVVVRSNDFKV